MRSFLRSLNADSELWLQQLDSYFTACGITSSSMRYYYAVSILSPAIEVGGILVALVRDKPFQTLTRALLTRLSSSSEEGLQHLLHNEPLRDYSPTQLFRHFRGLLSTFGKTSCQVILRPLFLYRMPHKVLSTLAVFRLYNQRIFLD